MCWGREKRQQVHKTKLSFLKININDADNFDKDPFKPIIPKKSISSILVVIIQ